MAEQTQNPFLLTYIKVIQILIWGTTVPIPKWFPLNTGFSVKPLSPDSDKNVDCKQALYYHYLSRHSSDENKGSDL